MSMWRQSSGSSRTTRRQERHTRPALPTMSSMGSSLWNTDRSASIGRSAQSADGVTSPPRRSRRRRRKGTEDIVFAWAYGRPGSQELDKQTAYSPTRSSSWIHGLMGLGYKVGSHQNPTFSLF